MKSIFTLALSILAYSASYAVSEFFLRINSPGNYTVSLDNQVITSPSNIYRFFDLYPGNYSLQVVENGFNGRVILDRPVNISNGYRIVAELDPYMQLHIVDQLPFTRKSWYIDQITAPPVQPIPRPYFPKPPKPHYPSYPNGCSHGPSCNNPGCYSGYNGNGYGYGNLMDNTTLQSLIQAMKNATFEEKMLEIARTALKDRQVKTDQVHQLITQFTFERNKLELAKYCYDRTIDKSNYFTLFNDFTFSSYSSELNEYINSH